MSARHTPGPWKLWTSCSWRRFGSETTRRTVCEPTLHPIDGWPDLHFANGGEDGPDARLIEASPDLLQSVQQLYKAVIALQRYNLNLPSPWKVDIQYEIINAWTLMEKLGACPADAVTVGRDPSSVAPETGGAK